MAFNIKRSAAYDGAGRFTITGEGGGLRLKITPQISISPDSLPGLVAWFKADSITGVVDGGSVTNWTDNSPNSNNLNTTSGTAPTYVLSNTSFNNKPTVRINNDGAIYRSNPTGLPVGSQAMTTYVVGVWNGTSGNHSMFTWGANSYPGNRWGVGSDGSSGILFESQGISSTLRSFVADVPFIFSLPYTAGAAYTSVTTYLNGVGVTGGSAATPNVIDPVQEIAIGRPATAGVEYWAGDVAEVIVYNTTHDAATRQAVEQYLDQKYGIYSQYNPPPIFVTSGLILHLDASNPTSYPGSGTTWYDLSGNGNDAAASGTPTYTVTNGGGFTFDSVSDYFDLSPNLQESYAGTGLTVAAWAKANTLPFVSGLVSREDWGASPGWALHEHFNNTLMGPRFGSAVSANNTVLTNTIYYLVFTINSAGNARVFINGLQSGATSSGVTVPTAASSSPQIGRFATGAYPWDGDIYEVHMYNKALNPIEVLQNFNATKTRFGL